MSDFFSVGVDELRDACTLGLNEATCFLTLACGTGRDNVTTSWSATAVNTHTGIAWGRAKAAIDNLVRNDLATVSGTRTKPRYKLKISEDRIWLPKSIVIALNDETPPVARIRQLQDVVTLQLYIELYHSQNLAENGGLSRDIYHRRYVKSKFCEKGAYTFFGFDPSECCGSTIPSVFKDCPEFHRRMQILITLGLLERSACLFEGDSIDSEILYPVDGPTDPEKENFFAIQEVADRLLAEYESGDIPHTYLVPVFTHQKMVELYDIFRLQHRPHTRLTGYWWAQLCEKVESACTGFSRMEAPDYG